MAKVLCILLIFLLSAILVTAHEDNSCSPWLGHCLVYDHCCRHLQCASYLNKCIPIHGVIVPGKDKRPIGSGPFPPEIPGHKPKNS